MKGILFSEPLFHKVVDGTKTQTRRILKPQQIIVKESVFVKSGFQNENGNEIKPRYKVGDTVFLQEPYVVDIKGDVCYKYPPTNILLQFGEVKWENKLFMPAKAARYFIKITGVRCKRLQDISDEDCMKEGIVPILQRNGGVIYNYGGSDNDNTPKRAYAALIDRIHKKSLWETNPFVWVYDFKLL
ncbi:MAG: hypothetical protein LBR10_14465 [Prevotellaceae bacterium]|jgi:hypothetical protein|nr:hypothetical protein [Prevotellaceae bacterium]